eukprot:2434511-Rhodomonas_salina.1
MPCVKRTSLLLALACWALFLGTVTSSGARPVRLLKNFGDDAIGALSSEEIVSFDSSDPAEESLSLSSAERRFHDDDRPWFFQETSSQPFLIAFSIGTTFWGMMAIAMVYGERNEAKWASAGGPDDPDLYSGARVFVGLCFVFFDFVVMCSKFNWYLTNEHFEDIGGEGSCNFLGIDYFQPALNVRGKSAEQVFVQISIGIGLIIYFILMIVALMFEEGFKLIMSEEMRLSQAEKNSCLNTVFVQFGRLVSGFFCLVILCQQYLVLMPLNEVTMEDEHSTGLSLDVPTDQTHALCLYAYAVQAFPLAFLFAAGAGVGYCGFNWAQSEESAGAQVFGIVCAAAGAVCAFYSLAFIVYWLFGGFAVGIWFFFASMKWNFKTGRVLAIVLGPNIADGLMQVVGFLARGCKGKSDWKSNNNSSSAGGQDGQGDHEVMQHVQHFAPPDEKDPQKNGNSEGQRPSSMPHAPSIPDPQPTRPTTISNFPPQYNVQASLAYGQQSPEGSVEYRPPGPPGPQASQGSCNCPECQRAMGSATTVHIHYHGPKPASAMHGGPGGPPGSCNCPQCQQAGGYSYPVFGGFGGYGGPMPGYGGPMPGYGGPPGFRSGY